MKTADHIEKIRGSALKVMASDMGTKSMSRGQGAWCAVFIAVVLVFLVVIA